MCTGPTLHVYHNWQVEDNSFLQLFFFSFFCSAEEAGGLNILTLSARVNFRPIVPYSQAENSIKRNSPQSSMHAVTFYVFSSKQTSSSFFSLLFLLVQFPFYKEVFHSTQRDSRLWWLYVMYRVLYQHRRPQVTYRVRFRFK